MARSFSEEVQHPPSPSRLADMALHHSFDDRSKPGTDIEHSGLRQRKYAYGPLSNDLQPGSSPQAGGAERDGQGDAKAAAVEPQTGAGIGRCVRFEQAPMYLRREFILSGYYVGE